MWELWFYSAGGFLISAGLSWLAFCRNPIDDDTNHRP